MLALARGEGQSIIIDGHIEVKIVKWSRSSVRLAIQAPREVTVDRDEIWRKTHPGELTPLEKAEIERRERFAREEAAAGGQPRPGAPAASDDAGAPVTTPVAGIYYASAGPGGSPYVSLGSAVEESTVVASVRNAEGVTDVRAAHKGTISKILVVNGQQVTVGQSLFLIKTSH